MEEVFKNINSDEIEPIDFENYQGIKKDVDFSHQTLVMSCMRRCIEAGCKEMRSGYWNDKSDRFGNVLKVYISDTRKEFNESVKNAEVMMACDLDEDATNKIKEIKEKIEKEFKKLCEMEKQSWELCGKLTVKSRHSRGIFFQSGTLNINLSYYQEYLDFEIGCYRDMLKELCLLTGRKKFYASELVGQRQEN